MPQPWQPPPIRSITTASCTSMSSTCPPWRATIGFTCSSNTLATCSYSASSLTAPAGLGLAATAGPPLATAARIAAPIAFPTACHGAGDCLTTVTMLPDTMSSLTARPGIAKIDSASGEPCASSGAENRRTPPASTGTLTTNLQRWVSIGSAVMRSSAASIPHFSRSGDHVLERGEGFVPPARLEPTVGVDPDLRVIQHARHALQRAGDLRHGRHAGRVNVVNTGADLVRVLVLFEALQQLGTRTGALDRDHVRIHALDDAQHVVELAVAHMRVNLRRVAHTCRREAERIDGPSQIGGPVRAAQRQTLAEGRLVDLNHPDAGRLEVDHLVADGEGDLLRGFRARLVVAHERPLQDRDRPGQHAFHRALRQRLRVLAPADGHRARPRDVTEDDRRLYIPSAVRLHPAVLGECEAGQLLAEVLDHVVALKLSMHEHVETEIFLQFDRLGDLRLDELVILLGGELIVVQLATRRPHFRRLRE